MALLLVMVGVGIIGMDQIMVTMVGDIIIITMDIMAIIMIIILTIMESEVDTDAIVEDIQAAEMILASETIIL